MNLGSQKEYRKEWRLSSTFLKKVGEKYCKSAEEEVEDEPVYIDRSLTIGGQTYYALRVVGESMIPEIRPQDKVVFRVQPVFNSGDIVVARIDGEATLKKAITVEKPRSVTLQPINPSYQPITFTGDTAEPQLEILGVVVQIIRNV